MIDYPKFLASEMHLGRFPDTMKFQSWKVNFKTEVCSKTADSHLTMQCMKEHRDRLWRVQIFLTTICLMH